MRVRSVPFIVFLLLALGASSTHAAPILLGNYAGHTYYLVLQYAIGWEAARLDVQTQVGPNYDLAAITSAEEQDFLASNLTGQTGEFWLGAYQAPPTGTADANWNWVTGEAWGYTNWASGEPNDYGSGEQYAGTWSSYGWAWNDEAALGNIRGYIAESVPDPGSSLMLLGLGLISLGVWRRR